MSIEISASDIHQDGTVTIRIDGKDVKFVRNSDLGAVKASLESKESEVTKLQASLADANTKYDVSHQEVLKERAAKEQLESGAAEHATSKVKVGELEKQVAELIESSGKTTQELTDRLRAHITATYKVGPEKIKDTTLEGLKSIENTFQITGVAPAAANYDGTMGNNGNNANLEGKSPLALATLGYEQSKGKK